MQQLQQVTEDQIKTTASVIKKMRPAYGPLIDFYQEVFLAQEESKKNLDMDPITIPPDLLSLKRDNAVPLVSSSDFTIDYSEAAGLLERLCDLAQRLAPKLSNSAATLKKAGQNGMLESRKLFDAIINDNNPIIHKLGESLGIPVQDLVFFAYAAIAPSIFTCASQLEPYLKNQPSWTKGYCPICGNHPDVAFFDKDGARHLVCGFCMHAWTFQRMGCVFCENRDAELQHYFFNEEEKEYRVDLCDHCRKYLKLIDLRELSRDFYPRLEQISSLHLDMKAKGKGYTRGSDA